jgi:CRP-like cAMP-binding protein
MKLFKTLMIQPGETVYSEGDPAFDFYIIIEGEIELSTTPPTRLTHSEGSFFGERELFFSADRVKSDRAMVYSGAGRDAANDTAQATLHDLFGRHRHHTATVVSKTRCKLKFLRWDQLLHIVTMKQTKAQKDAGVPHPGPEIYKRIEHYAIQRHRAEEREWGGDATAGSQQEENAAYYCWLATNAAKTLQRRFRALHQQKQWGSGGANMHREAAQQDIMRMQGCYGGTADRALSHGGDGWEGGEAAAHSGGSSTAGDGRFSGGGQSGGVRADRAMFLELLAGQKGAKNGIFFEFSLYLSRACLGKMIVLMYKWLKNAVFRRDAACAERSAGASGRH